MQNLSFEQILFIFKKYNFMKKKFPTKHSLSSFTLNPQNWNLSFISVTTPIHQGKSRNPTFIYGLFDFDWAIGFYLQIALVPCWLCKLQIVFVFCWLCMNKRFWWNLTPWLLSNIIVLFSLYIYILCSLSMCSLGPLLFSIIDPCF